MRSKACFLAPVINVEVAKTDTSFLTSKALDTWLYSLLYIRVIIRDLNYVFLPPPLVIDLCCIESGGRIGRIPLVFMLLSLLIFLGLIGRLRILDESEHRSFSLRFVPVIIFYCSLSLKLVCSNVGPPSSLENL